MKKVSMKERFLKNEFLTMSVFGALGRSKTYSTSAGEEAKNRFRNALREKLDELSVLYKSAVTEKDHLSNIETLSNDLTSRFQHYLRNGRFRIGIAQKALNLYLKYLWCVNLISEPPHCPFDSIVISYLRDSTDLKWTSIDTIEDYIMLVRSARKISKDKSLPVWELEIWLKSIQPNRERELFNRSGTENVQQLPPMETYQPDRLSYEGGAMIDGTVTSQGVYADGKDICELYISVDCSNRLPHEYGNKKRIDIRIRNLIYEAGVHQTKKGVVWISSVLHNKGARKEKARLVDVLAQINVKKGDTVIIKRNEEDIFSLEKME
jgi:hypothetical protein